MSLYTQDNFLSDNECESIYVDSIQRKNELYKKYFFYEKTHQQMVDEKDFLSSCLKCANNYFDLSSMVGCEVWYNYSFPSDIESHPWHIDKDEIMFIETKIKSYPLCTLVYYPFIGEGVGGEFVYRTDQLYQISPKTNKIICFGPGIEHKTNPSNYERISISICPWNYKVKKLLYE